MRHRYAWLAMGLVVTAGAFAVSADWLGDADDPFHMEQSDGRNTDGVRFHVEPYLQLPTTDGMTIMWETSVPLAGAVEYGPSPQLGHVAIEEAAEAKLHQVRIDGLDPGTACYYRVRSGPLVSKVHRFRTAPTPGTGKWRMALYGDSRSNPVVHRKVVEQIAKANVDLILHTGDIVLDGTNYNSWRIEFFGPLAPIAGSVPWVSAIGNHERDSKNYFSYAALPGNERHFSFDYANAHLVGLDSNSWIQRGRDSKQYQWLENDLKAARDATWTFVYFHHPLFSGHRDRGINPLRWDWAPLFLDPACRVDGVLNGHDHFYVRNHRMARLEEGPQAGVLFMTSAGGGAPLYPLTQRDYVAYCRSVHHFTLFDFDGEEVTITPIDITGRVFDRHVLKKDPTPPQELCAYDVEELREFLRKALAVAPSIEVNPAGITRIDTVLAVPTRFRVPVAGKLRWQTTPGWELPAGELPFGIQPGQPLRLPLQAAVLPTGLGKSPRLTIEFASGRFANRITEVSPFKLTGGERVAVAAAQQVQVDGRATEEVWSSIAALPLLGAVEGEPSRVQFSSDGKHLFLLARLTDPHRHTKVSPLGTVKTPSRGVLTGEHVRVEIQDGQTAHSFAFSPEQIPYHELDGKEAPARWQAAAASGQGFWTAELAIPLDDFKSGKDVRINVVHRARQPSKLLQLRGTYQEFELRPAYALGSHPDRIPDWTPKRTPERFASLVLP